MTSGAFPDHPYRLPSACCPQHYRKYVKANPHRFEGTYKEFMISNTWMEAWTQLVDDLPFLPEKDLTLSPDVHATPQPVLQRKPVEKLSFLDHWAQPYGG